MKQKREAGRAAFFLLAGVMLLCLILPVKALFTGDGVLGPYLAVSAAHQMWLEIGFLALWFGGVLFLRLPGWQRLLIMTGSILLFCWLHVVSLPMLITGLYVLFLILVGRFLRCGLFRMRQFGGWPADFVLGSSFVITLFCLLSLAGVRACSSLRLISLGLFIVLCLWYLFSVLRKEEQSPLESLLLAGEELEQSAPLTRLGLLFILLLLLLQMGRINLTLDFDTLWYGVRSEYLLNGSGGIYENPGMVSMVYVYSKGWEILTLPLCDLPSHTYLSFLHIWMLGLGIAVTGRLARLSMKPEGVCLSMLLTAAIPGITNMAVSAKTDMITWLLQLIMLDFFFTYIKEEELKKRVSYSLQRRGQETRPAPLLLLTAGTYFLSLTMKPSALVFSTAVFGMMGIYLLFSGRFSVNAGLLNWLSLLFPAAALTLVWLRTYRITGMPVTSIFTSVFAKLGFEMKYPFAVSRLPANYQEAEPMLLMFVRRLYQLLLSPEGKDMTHVVMAWGSSLMFYLPVVMVLSVLGVSVLKRNEQNRPAPSFRLAVWLIFWPFFLVNLLSLIMLYQIDGNYFMLLYSMILLIASQFFSEFADDRGRALVLVGMAPLLALNLVVSSITSWAWSIGFTPIQVKNKGYVNHEENDKQWLVSRGNEALWSILETNPEYRVIAFGEHPYCLQFPCKVQSYRDVTSPWGNVELVNSAEAFEEYMEYSQTDYIYAQAEYLGEESWSWSYDLLKELIARGTITECLYEWGNFLGKRAKEQISPEEAAENLRIFEEQYKTCPVTEASGLEDTRRLSE